MKMQKMTYSIDIKAPQEKVWDTMLKPETYPQWTKAFSEHSEFIGQWKKGERMKFIDKDLGGTVALLETVEAPSLVVAKHVAMINDQGAEETTGPITENWVGTMEIYRLNKNKSGTHLEVEIDCHPDFEKMFSVAWPKALNDLKRIVEQ